MASRNFNQFTASLRFGLKFLEGSFKVGASGAVVANSFTGGGITASSTVTVQKLGTGLYSLQLADPYYRLVGAHFTMYSPTSAGIVTDGNLVVGQPYQIVGGTSGTVGSTIQPSTSTNYYTLGLPVGLNPQSGQTFVASSGASNVPGSSSTLVGQGVFLRVKPSNIDKIEMLPGANTTLAPSSASSGVNGSIFLFYTLDSSLNAASPTQNSWIRWNMWLDNSTRLLYNESTTAN